VQFTCAEDEYNPIASLLVSTSHSSVKLLFSGENAGEFSSMASLLAFLTYSTLNVCLGGLPVPGGAFTATMLMGAMFGRSVGAFMDSLGYPSTISGVYAVVGSAAMLCGFKQMTLASVLIVIECINDLQLAPIVMLGVGISMAINWTLNERGHDEVLILRKKLPFLEAEPPRELENLMALDLCDRLPFETVLKPTASLASVEQALKEKDIMYFPIRSDATGPCIGIVTRSHLEGVFQAASQVSGSNSSARTAEEIFPDTEMFTLAYRTGRADMSSGIPLEEIMDPTPLTIVDDTPAPRLYAMFSKAGERAAIVTSRVGEFRGIISREGLVAHSRPAII
jgi:chloride channel 7